MKKLVVYLLCIIFINSCSTPSFMCVPRARRVQVRDVFLDKYYIPSHNVNGIASAFGETNSKIIVADKDTNGNFLRDEKDNIITKTITREELATGNYKNYEVLGIMSGEKGAVDEIKLRPNTAERTNPTDGLFGDLIESGLGKIFNAVGASDMMAMSREVSLDLKELSKNPTDLKIENANFHSQGTIIEQGALQNYKRQYTDKNGNKTSYQDQVPLNPKIKYNSLGYAVYEDTINNMFIKDFKFKINPQTDKPLNVNFDRYDTDPVKQSTAPTKWYEPFVALKNFVFNLDSHSVNNNKFDKYYDSVDLTERSKIDMNRYNGKKDTDYNLVRPGLNNNGVNYVIPSYSVIRNKK